MPFARNLATAAPDKKSHLSFGHTVRYLALVASLITTAGCATSHLRDDRLLGTWRSNGEQTIANMLKRDARWTAVPPDRMQKVRDMFGQMTVTYGEGTVVTRFNGEEATLRFKVVESGPDHVVIRIKGGLEDGQKKRLRFVDDARAYWIQSSLDPRIEERFDKMDDAGAGNVSRPATPKTNPTASAISVH